ncbi:hypothetical protein [Streptomyces sp. VNUA74]|uniref:hypothetical protein n=1 Tax=Streptomyces sp. VNUA74 TaxID=3062685 RepID=UPI00280A53E8|nr:hypothetical protein [Streptomyces sp. VNUA74]WML79178.1 hypothetical protein Q3101_04695 [Streptomyces sp. VNUA74]
MPKITRHGGPSDARDLVEGQPAVEDAEPTEEGEQPSAGTSSSASPLKTASTSKKSAAPRQRRARTTESRSSRGREENSSVPGTDGDLSATADDQTT